MPTRAEALRTMEPQLIADLTLYPTSEGGKKLTIQLGYGCPCLVSKEAPLVGYDGWPLLEEPLAPDSSRRVGFVFPSGQEAADIFRHAAKFYLWEGRFIGEASVVP